MMEFNSSINLFRAARFYGTSRILLIFLVFLCSSFGASATAANESKTPLDAESQKQNSVKRVFREGKMGAVTNKSKSIVERLEPGDDFLVALKRIASANNIKAGVIVSAVGSFSSAGLRFAGANDATTLVGPFEVVSVTGTISDTSMHVHLSVADSSGKTIGGHLMPGCKVFTTIELVILDLSDEWSFERKTDAKTTYQELEPRRIHSDR